MIVASLLTWPPVTNSCCFQGKLIVPSSRTWRSHLPGSKEHSKYSKHQLTVRRAGIEFRLEDEMYILIYASVGWGLAWPESPDVGVA